MSTSTNREPDSSPAEPLLKPVPVIDVLTSPVSAPEFVWDGYLPRGVVSLLSGHGGTGKSTVSLMLAVSVATGRHLFGVQTRNAPAVYVSLEDGSNIVRHRLATICRAWKIDPRDLEHRLYIVDGTDNPELFNAESRSAGDVTAVYGELSLFIAKVNPGLVIIDNASDAFGGDEINRRQVRRFMGSLKQIAKNNDCAVCLLAHVDKTTSRYKKADGGEGYSGSTAWHNGSRSRLYMSRSEYGQLILEHQKNNLGPLREKIAMEWPDGELPLSAGAGNTSCGDDERTAVKTQLVAASALLALIAEFESRGQYCSTAINSRNNPFAVLKSEPSFQKLKLKSDDVKRVITFCQRMGWLEPMDYRSVDRKPHQRWTLTFLGKEQAGLSAPTAPTAPSTQDGAS